MEDYEYYEYPLLNQLIGYPIEYVRSLFASASDLEFSRDMMVERIAQSLGLPPHLADPRALIGSIVDSEPKENEDGTS